MALKTMRSALHREGFEAFVQHYRAQRARKRLPVPEAPRGFDDTRAAAVRVNWGQWIIDCPFCPSAILADPDDRRFYCLECGSADNGHRWIAVVWPNEAAAIEDELLKRPREENRNWFPGEDTFKLRLEREGYEQWYAAVGRHLRK